MNPVRPVLFLKENLTGFKSLMVINKYSIK